MIDLDAVQMKVVNQILQQYVPKYEVRAFGSRVTGTCSRFSDLDLALVGTEAVEWPLLEAIKDAFSESDLDIMVDVLDWQSISESFRQEIGDQYEVVQVAKNQ
jgi:predicted nucleotidyltransferase